MDVAVDHIQEEALSPEVETAANKEEDKRPRAASNDLGTDFKEAYQAISSTAWGSRLGGFFGQVKKQGESYYTGARKELDAAIPQAKTGFAGLVSQAQALSAQATQSTQPTPSTSSDPTSTTTPRDSTTPETPSTDYLKETTELVTRFKREGAQRLKQIQAAEDAADDALERFGTNITSWFKEAVTIAPPSSTSSTKNPDGSTKSKVLFESKDAEGKRIVHATRFDAQLHVIHTSPRSFTDEPDSALFKPWAEAFDVEVKTEDVKRDLERYEELRRAMERLVPEKVVYRDFWTRYYFLRHVIESEERKRRELLRGTQDEVEEVGWGDDEEEEELQGGVVPSVKEPGREVEAGDEKQAVGGAETPIAGAAVGEAMEKEHGPDAELLKPNEPRRSNEHSVADSDASYDIVSGAPSRGPDTPTKEKNEGHAEQSDEDWE